MRTESFATTGVISGDKRITHKRAEINRFEIDMVLPPCSKGYQQRSAQWIAEICKGDCESASDGAAQETSDR